LLELAPESSTPRPANALCLTDSIQAKPANVEDELRFFLSFFLSFFPFSFFLFFYDTYSFQLANSRHLYFELLHLASSSCKQASQPSMAARKEKASGRDGMGQSIYELCDHACKDPIAHPAG